VLVSCGTAQPTPTVTKKCTIQGKYPDTSCTPGAYIQTATKDIICKPGYAGSVRNVPPSLKHKVYQSYGILTHISGSYEIDHLISLELGGSNDIKNLWPEASSPKPGYHEKDKVENYLHKQVCVGKLSLDVARQQIATNWLSVYNQM